jgi:hypothetical protein
MKIIEKNFNVETGEETITERDETAAEKKARETRQAEIDQALLEANAKQAQRVAIAEKLGLSVDELQSLLG